jgi:hypothetical protein
MSWLMQRIRTRMMLFIATPLVLLLLLLSGCDLDELNPFQYQPHPKTWMSLYLNGENNEGWVVNLHGEDYEDIPEVRVQGKLAQVEEQGYGGEWYVNQPYEMQSPLVIEQRYDGKTIVDSLFFALPPAVYDVTAEGVSLVVDDTVNVHVTHLDSLAMSWRLELPSGAYRMQRDKETMGRHRVSIKFFYRDAWRSQVFFAEAGDLEYQCATDMVGDVMPFDPHEEEYILHVTVVLSTDYGYNYNSYPYYPEPTRHYESHPRRFGYNVGHSFYVRLLLDE